MIERISPGTAWRKVIRSSRSAKVCRSSACCAVRIITEPPTSSGVSSSNNAISNAKGAIQGTTSWLLKSKVAWVARMVLSRLRCSTSTPLGRAGDLGCQQFVDILVLRVGDLGRIPGGELALLGGGQER